MFFHRLIAAFSLTTCVILLAGCTTVQEEPAEPGPIKFKRPDKIVYQQIPSAGCELQVPQDVKAVAGNQCNIDVQLFNNSRRGLVIKEWYMVDQNNFTVFYRRLPADRPVDKNAPFMQYTPVIPLKPLPRHAELRLHPGNRAMLTVELPFVARLLPGDSAIYEVYIATSLNTFKLRSKRFNVYVE